MMVMNSGGPRDCGQRLRTKGLQFIRPYYMQFTMHVSEAEFYEIVCEEVEKDFEALKLAYPKEEVLSWKKFEGS